MAGYANINIGNAKMSPEGIQNMLGSAPPSNTAQGYYKPSYMPSSPNQLYNAGTTTVSGQPVNSFANTMKQAGISNVPLPPPPGPSQQIDWSKTPGGTFYQGGYKEPGWTPPPEFANYNVPNHPPLMNADGSDTEFGKLIKMGALNDPNLRPRYNQLLNDWLKQNGLLTPPTPPRPPSPVVPSTITGAPPSPTGATAPASGVSSGKAGVTGQPFPISNLTTDALSFLQNLPNVSPSISSLASIPKGIMDFFSSSRPGSWGTPEEGLTEKLQKVLSSISPFDKMVKDTRTFQGGSRLNPFRTDNQFLQKLPSFRGTGYGTEEQIAGNELVTIRPTQGVLDAQTQRPGQFQIGQSSLSPQGQVGFTPNQGAPASQQNLAGNLTGQQAQQAISAVTAGVANVADVAPAIANRESPALITKAMNQAVRTGDMNAVGRLAELHNAVIKQLDFISQIGQIVASIAQGFGSPQSAELTGARMPMVEQGIGQALTTAPQMPYYPGVTPTQGAQTLPFRLPEVEQTQRNRPVFPNMGGGR